MELVKNKSSGRFFVVIDDTEGSDFLLITPEGKAKRLERHLFIPVEPGDAEEAFFKRQLTHSQVDMYAKFRGNER